MFDRLAELREKRENGESGFTLIELLVVVVIIGILIAIAIPLYLNYKKGAADKAAQSDLRGAVAVLEQCNSDNSSYPTAVVGGSGGLTGCTGQQVNLSGNTTIKYTPTPAAAPVTSYIMASTSTSGSGKIYCYNSTKAGTIADVSASGVTVSNATC